MKGIFCTLGIALALLVTAEGYNFRTVVIDAGHGGQDNGGQWGRVYEKHLALDTALRLEAYLKKMGFHTVMTRRSDYFVTLPGRMAIANRYSDAVFVSIHFNYTWKEGVSGIETFHHSAQSRGFAQAVHGRVINRVKVNDRGVKFARFYVIRNCKLPAVLVESGFVSNASERDRMKTAGFRDGIARGIAEGILRFRRGG